MKKVFLLIAVVATLLPVFFTVHVAGGWESWRGVLPKGTTDSLYYYARIKEVVDGYPMNGNPYVYEYRNESTPAFFIPDIVSALPMLVGVPFNIGIVLNIFVWSFLLLLLAFQLLKLLGVERRWSVVFSVLVLIVGYTFMLRPTIMQIIYPLLLLFLVVFVQYLDDPKSRRKAVYLAVVSSLTFYFYTYLAYVVVLTLLFALLYYLFARKFGEAKSLVGVGILSLVLLVPFAVYTWAQVTGPYYLETITRIGLAYTHVPMPSAFLYGRWVVIGLILVWLLPMKHGLFWFSTGTALLVSIFLNVFTGVELQLGTHIGRFVIMWTAILTGVSIYEFVDKSYDIKSYRYLIPLFLIILMSTGVMRNAHRGFDFFKFDERGEKTANIQAYAGPLRWLEENVSHETVVMANPSLSQYISINTRHYPFYFEGAKLHHIPNQELLERRSIAESNQVKELEQFGVNFILIDREDVQDTLRAYNLRTGSVYDDGRFAIFPVE